MMADLIDGNLIKILNASTDSQSIAFIVRDDHSRTGFGMVYHPFEDENTSPHGKQVTPQNATDEDGVVDGKRGQVEDYLVESFGLTSVEAKYVVDEAHSVPA